MLSSEAGLQRLVHMRVREQDPIEFKVRLDRRDPAWRHELRRDCAALATTGVGFLVVGVDESRDGASAARGLVGVPEAQALADSIRDSLGSGFSPPITKRAVWTVAVTDRHPVVVVRVEGRSGYPIEVEDLPTPPRHFVREAAGKRALFPEAARIRRAAIESREGRFTFMAVVGTASILLVVGGTLAIDALRRSREREWSVDPDLCFRTRLSGSIVAREFELSELQKQATKALQAGDAAGCSSVHSELVARYPRHVGRHFLEAECLQLAGRRDEAVRRFQDSSQLAQLALARRPKRVCWTILDAFSRQLAGDAAGACRVLTEFASSTPKLPDLVRRDGLPPLLDMRFECASAADLLREMGAEPDP